MAKMRSNEIRNEFFEFFKEKNHKVVPSAPVVPYDDPTLLFTNAGMNQFKDVFLGTGKRDYKRAVDTQKCIRVSGKHNDLEEVGYDTYHHTFFEMLGNWSFGDYYKEEAIIWAWEILTERFKLPKERLFATVYRTDDEAFELWKTKTDINPEHILRFDEKDNFWEMGETGPCGPCSEIHINLADDYDNPTYVNAGTADCIEIWNLVFIQYNRDETGKLNELPSKHVDTGMGFERLCAVMQGKRSNYDTDVFTPLISEIEKISSINYEKEIDMISMRVIADHVRALTFAIADGAMPGNEGRGYVLRRLLRRAARYGRKLNLTEPFMFKLVNVLVENMSHVFPELKTNQSNIEKIIKAEEESFNSTLDRGIELFENITSKAEVKKTNIIPGEDVFKLYDTYGFPFDLTNVMAREKGMNVDETGFNKYMNQQKERARKSTKDKLAGGASLSEKLAELNLNSDIPTQFLGYEVLESESEIIFTTVIEVNRVIVLDRTPFYAESGGQASDTGSLTIAGAELTVIDVVKIQNQFVHIVENTGNVKIEKGMKAMAKVDSKRRWDIMRNHSATHFLHTALRTVLGAHVQQAGSYVGPDHLRFDFTHFEKVKPEELKEIELLINEKLRENMPMTHHKNTPFEDAKKMGALMFFGDKYGDKVNVVQFGDYTLEFCGGTHVHNSSQIGMLKIINETSIASGVRRIEAVTGAGVEKYIHDQETKLLEAENKYHSLHDEKKKLEKELAEIKLKEKLSGIDSIIKSGETAGSYKIFKSIVVAESMDELKSMGDELRMKMNSGIGLLISAIDEKVGVVAVVSDDLIKEKKLSAGKIVGEVAKILGGGGGGRPHLATAGGKDIHKIDEAISFFSEYISKL
ncbi:MAG: alanine--tRNA ligase [Ignavibacteriaceae bacterium]|jgi:alanyl-tRNA synthetase|nr:alanine--tRNA ligase [Ignavibacteriaceae bacterium]